ncbi:DUF4345 family protein [Tianweitania sediminis]|jgi:hypothetical protein|uniref:DUF4345 family protein n=1 Tax=Tianweitania sediminis TaxID=1502156 RepID=A0A8J7UG04_9HYPH|nr:DUF4345 family protein [Tianweitania sediminis]MBP0437644.1 DUF4345 family protein [Tianweitania sediminis]HEV7417128.1 DUF4345 family protein [Tianweitania sediminis]
MNIAFPWPVTDGEWLAFLAATITILFGLAFLIAPYASFRLLRLQPAPGHPAAIAEGRSRAAGFYLGVGLCCLLTGQFWIYLALGFSWAFAAFGRLVAILSDKASTLANWLWLALETFLACLALVYALGLVP